MKRLIVPVVAGLVLLAGCSVGVNVEPATTPAPATTVTVTPAPAPTVTVTTPPEDTTITPTSLTDLRDQLVAAGMSCDDWSVTVKNFSGACDDLILMTYLDGSNKKSDLYQATQYFAWTAIRDNKREGDIALLAGDNWFLRISLKDARTLHDDLGTGGVILH